MIGRSPLVGEQIFMDQMYKQLRDFRLAGMVKTLQLRLNQAAQDNLSCEEFLQLLLEDEKSNREDNKRQRLYRQAHFPYQKQLEEFDFSFQPSIKKRQILELANCSFIAKSQNVIFIGQTGTGKTHLAIALGLKALGYGYRVLFTSVWEMISNLQAGRADYSYRRKVEQYVKPDLLILDELGYRSMGEATVEDFYEIVAKRYERKSIIITSNRELTSWDKIFVDKTLTGAIIDRLIHHCHTVLSKGESYRYQNRLKN